MDLDWIRDRELERRFHEHEERRETERADAEASQPDEDRLNLTPVDFSLDHHGSIMLVRPENDAARAWIDENVYGANDMTHLWFGGALVVEPRYLEGLIDGIRSDGLTVAE